jgi:16S rRNA (adenine1518-N6/adenine1519-N6)-dimethyltransferase
MMQQKHIHQIKSLGQHFLHDPRLIRQIIQSLKLVPDDIVLEIGFGTGALTREVVGKVRDYIGVEIDKGLHEALSALAGPHALFLNQDILSLDLALLWQKYSALGGRFKVVGNLPYYISSPILQYLARYSSCLSLAVVMLQAEVADRLAASPGTKSYGVLTLLVQYFFRVKELFAVSPRAFSPAPQVYSKVLELSPLKSKVFNSEEETDFFQFAKQAFSHRRKTLLNCLKGYRDCSPRQIEEHLVVLKFPANIRAEALALADFIALYQNMRRHEGP